MYSLAQPVSGTILSKDYNYVPGRNSCKIIVYDEKYTVHEVEFNYDFSQRRITIVNNWLEGDTVSAQRENKVVFPEDESGNAQADGFRSIAVSG